jgi:PAS domain S-box-containing protein
MVAVAVVGFVGVGAFTADRTLDHARDLARQDAAFQAKLGAHAIDDAFALGQTTLAGMAGNFPTAQVVATPEKCRLLFTGLGPFPAGHIDVVLQNGRVACSSLAPDGGAPAGASHQGAAWLSQTEPAPAPGVSAPFTDRLTGSPAIAIATQIPDADGQSAKLAVVLPLPALAGGLAATYAGPRGLTFTVMAGSSLISGATTAAAASGGDEAALITGSAAVTGLGWRVDASMPESEALAPTRALLLRGSGLGIAALILVLILLLLVNRKIAKPWDQLAVAEARIRASEEHLRLLLQGARDYSIVMLDVNGRVTSWSPSAQLLDGYLQDDILGHPYEVFFPAEESAAGVPEESLATAAATGRYEHEGVRVRKDGSRYWARTVITARRDMAGEVLGYVTVAHDATVRHEVELATNQMNAELEQRVERRTTQLAQQTAALHAANAELQAFSYSVSHDLRAPLRAIIGFAGILAEEELPGESGFYLSRIAAGAETLTNMVDALLSLSATQQLAIDAATLDLTTLARSAWDELAPELDGRSVDFVLHQLPPGRGDSRLVRQVLANLIGNSVKYTRTRDAATIEVGSRPADDGPVYFVRDNGVGFDMLQAEGLFTVFRRLHRADEFPGTGIGLASVQRIVARHGGRVWAEAEVDRGATFYFTLGSSMSDHAETAQARPPRQDVPAAVG